MSLRVVPRLRHLGRAVPARSLTTTPARLDAADDKKWPQAHPVGNYYEHLVNDPIPYPWTQKPEEPPSSADPSVLPDERKPAGAKAAAASPAPAPSDTPTAKPKRKLRISSKAKLNKPEPNTTSANSSTANSSSSSSAAPAEPEREKTPEEKARIIFGTRLAGPEDRKAHFASRQSKATIIAGVAVPPEPEEPDNCCMSGCVNCVWELYREDMEEFRAAKKEAERRQAAQRAGASADAVSMDDDGGGSESNWTADAAPQGVKLNEKAKISSDMWDDDLFQNVPVGIREFMKQEKKLREKHEREGTA